MKPKNRKVEKLSRVLTEPVVRFVSLVSHAATQTPFKFLKAAHIAPIDESDLGVIQADITRPIDGDDVMVQKFTFPADKFDMVQASNYAKELGFEDFTTERDGDVVIVKSAHFEQFSNDIATIKTDNGVLMFVGSLKGDDAGEVTLQEAPEEIQRSDVKIPHLKGVEQEVLQKYDPYVSWWSSETDIGNMINEGMYDGLPIGAPEISNAYWSVVANATKDGNMNAIRKASSDMGNLIVALWDLYSGLASSDNLEILSMSKEAQERLVKNEAGSEAAAEQATNDQAVEEPKLVDGVEAEEAAAAEENKEEAVAEGDEGKEVAEKAAVTEEAPATQELTQESIALMIKEACAPYHAAQEEMKKTIEAQEKQIKSLEGSAIQRRGVETNDEEGSRKSSEEVKEETLRKQISQAQAEKNIRNLLGL